LRHSRTGFPAAAALFLFFRASRPFSEPAQPQAERVVGASSPAVKRLEREADHLPPSTAQIKNEWKCISTPQYGFMACTRTT
jgi:hypothetical protein